MANVHKLLVAGMLAVLAGPADADLFDLTWAGDASGSATGQLDFDPSDSSFSNPGNVTTAGGWNINSFSITVTGAATGNGTFTFAGGDFTNIIIDTISPVNLSAELVGQAGFFDFNMFSVGGSGAPTGDSLNVFIPAEGSGGELFTLTSFAPAGPAAVPEIDPNVGTSAVVALAFGLTMLGYRRREHTAAV